MNEQEAIKWLKALPDRLMRIMMGYGSHDTQVRTAIDVAVDALEKQMPKKPNKKESFVDIGHCKDCESLVTTKCRYCPKCGQKLDWSE